jgi:DNA replication licensing factor MCM4
MKFTFDVVYNLSTYADKQFVKFQERSDEVPEGETPTTMNLIVYDDLVDECKPGDEIQVIGIY